MLVKTFLFLFLAALFVFNWRSISPLFYYFDWRFVGSKISGLLPSLDVSFLGFSENKKEGFLKIPKLDVAAFLIFTDEENPAELEKLLQKGVVLYPGSSLPGRQGTMIILGHSAPANWPKINYDWVFSQLNKLERNDEIVVSYQGTDYLYKVVEQNIFSTAGEKQFLSEINNIEKSVLVLTTCWPPGKDFKRFVVLAELEK